MSLQFMVLKGQILPLLRRVQALLILSVRRCEQFGMVMPMSWWLEEVKRLLLPWVLPVFKTCERSLFEVMPHSRRAGHLIVTETVLCWQKGLALLFLKNSNTLASVGRKYMVSSWGMVQAVMQGILPSLMKRAVALQELCRWRSMTRASLRTRLITLMLMGQALRSATRRRR